MRTPDIANFSYAAVRGYPARSALMLLAMAIGVAAVVMLTSLGEGARRYVTGQFASLGTHLLIVIPGRSETSGGAPATFVGETPRDLTIQDARSLLRSRAVNKVAPVIIGTAPVSWGGRERDVPILGSTEELLKIRHWYLERGRFLPSGDPERAVPVCVIGGNVKDELFGANDAMGRWVRIGDRRFRVIGIMGSEGRSIGVDVQDLVIVPVASTQVLFNTSSLFRILVEARSRESIEPARQFIVDTIKARHQGEEDVTVITQDAVLSTFDRIFGALTLTVAGIAAISLAVAGILIMNVMLVAVSQRTAEIGLLKAIGASPRQITVLFLTEAGFLSLIGALLGLLLGYAGSAVIGWVFPAIPMGAPLWAVAAAIVVAVGTGFTFGLLPARRAAKLDPVMSLSKR